MNLTWASIAANGVLVIACVVLLQARGEDHATIKTLRNDAAAVAELRKEDAKRVLALEARNGALLTASAQRCGAEGTSAFDRGVRTGMAICQARAPQ